MENFINMFLNIEAETLSKNTIKDLQALNESVNQLECYLHGNINQSISPGKRTEYLPDSFYIHAITHKPRHLYKISRYINSNYGEISVAYLSYPNPRREAIRTSINQAFIIAYISNQPKIIGSMTVTLNNQAMEPTG